MISAIRKYYPDAANEFVKTKLDVNLLNHYINKHNYEVRGEYEVR